MDQLLERDITKYKLQKERMPLFQYFFRKTQASSGFTKKFYHFLLVYFRKRNCVDIAPDMKIGGVVLWSPICYNNKRPCSYRRQC